MSKLENILHGFDDADNVLAERIENTNATDVDAYALKTFNKIPANSDLNTYIVPGTYGQGYNAAAYSILHKPYTKSPHEFKLIVENFFPGYDTYVIQRLTRWSCSGEYIRETSDGGKTWSEWRCASPITQSATKAISSGGTDYNGLMTIELPARSTAIVKASWHTGQPTGIRLVDDSGNVIAVKESATHSELEIMYTTWGSLSLTIQIKNASDKCTIAASSKII